MPLSSSDVDAATLRAIEATLLDEIDELDKTRAVSPADLLADLRAVGLSLNTCDGDPACLGRAARYARSHYLVEVWVASLAGTLAISARLIDTQSGAITSRVSQELSDQPEQRALDLHRASVRLLAPDTYVGNLTITVSVDGAEIYLDDQLLGTSPLPGLITGLAGGTHILRVSKAGYSDLYRFVDVTYRRTQHVEIDLETNTIAAALVKERGTGQLQIITDIEGLMVRIEGEPVGVTPLPEPITQLVAGTHQVTLRAEGREPIKLDVVIADSKRTYVVIDTNMETVHAPAALDAPPPPLATETILAASATSPAAPALHQSSTPPVAEPSRWRLVSALVAGGLSAGSFAAMGVMSAQLHHYEGQANRLAVTARAGTGDYNMLRLQYDAAVREGRTREVAQWTTLGIGVGLALTAVTLWIWDVLLEP